VTHKAARAYGRVFFASAHDEVPDKQGRVTIPAHLREYAGLDRDLAVIGASNRVEIWYQQSWETYLATSEDAFSEIEEGVLPGGL
jgi:MraZ protein